MIFEKDSTNCVVIMYPTGGYGNFLYYLLSEFLKDTVKSAQSNFHFSDTGNSHAVYKYTEPFLLGKSYQTKQIKDFSYGYRVVNDACYTQIKEGKKFLVLADMGNLGDNVKFLKRYFPFATILRIYASTFEEKFVVWYNCIYKSYQESNIFDSVYKDSIHTINGIAKFSNKLPGQITDQDAIDCAVNFFQNDFEIYGKFFNQEIKDANVINIPVKSFFDYSAIVDLLHSLAKKLGTEVINNSDLVLLVKEFLDKQKSLRLLDSNLQDQTITGQALKIFR